jgi:hypothetical protein
VTPEPNGVLFGVHCFVATGNRKCARQVRIRCSMSGKLLLGHCLCMEELKKSCKTSGKVIEEQICTLDLYFYQLNDRLDFDTLQPRVTDSSGFD